MRTMYYHKQTSPVQFLFFLIPALAFFVAWTLQTEEPLVSVAAGIMGITLLIFAFSFQTLTISDEGDYLDVRYGPLRLFRKRFNYQDITAVETGRTLILDGWGIHFIPFRGWTFNLFGFECVVVHLGDKTVRVGTDDAVRLVDYLNDKKQISDAKT